MRWGWLVVAVGAAITAVLLLPTEAWAQLSELETRVETKFREALQLGTKVAWGVMGLVAVALGVRLTKADPSFMDRALNFVLGAVAIASASYIILWAKA